MNFDRISSDLEAIIWSWGEMKQFIQHSLGFNLDAVHVIVGVLIFLAAALLLRRPVSSLAPWLVVFVLTCFNEAMDLWLQQWPNPAIQYGEGLKDILLTLLLPTVLLLTARRFPRLYVARDPGAAGPVTD
jgi:uncharacterized membrane protein